MFLTSAIIFSRELWELCSVSSTSRNDIFMGPVAIVCSLKSLLVFPFIIDIIHCTRHYLLCLNYQLLTLLHLSQILLEYFNLYLHCSHFVNHLPDVFRWRDWLSCLYFSVGSFPSCIISAFLLLILFDCIAWSVLLLFLFLCRIFRSIVHFIFTAAVNTLDSWSVWAHHRHCSFAICIPAV